MVEAVHSEVEVTFRDPEHPHHHLALALGEGLLREWPAPTLF